MSSKLIGIVGETGTGKSTAIKHLNPEETYIINVAKKELPFKGSEKLYNAEKKNYKEVDDPVEVTRLLKTLSEKAPHKPQYWKTLFISGGRKDKISKGDIAGLFFKQGKLNKHELGTIELKQDCAFVAVPLSLADDLVLHLNNKRLKKKKVRVTLL